MFNEKIGVARPAERPAHSPCRPNSAAALNSSEISLRRLEQDERREYADLLALTRPQRLFVQRWIELFDRDAILGFRCRPFSRQEVVSERVNLGVNRYHQGLIDDELAVTIDSSLEQVDLALISSQPIPVAETLAQAASALGFDHRFLFHAYKAMLYPPEVPFETRLERLCGWWTGNAPARAMTIIFRTLGGGTPPRKSSSLSVLRWDNLSSQIQECAKRCKPWWQLHRAQAETNGYFLAISIAGNNPDGATSLAFDRYHDEYRRFLSIGSKAITIDEKWAFVDDPDQQPRARTYAIQQVEFHYRIRKYDATIMDRIADAAAGEPDLQNFWKWYHAALDDVERDRTDDALADIAAALDIAFLGYTPDGGADWGRLRIFVETAAMIEALNWLGTQYRYLLEYILKPSWSMGGNNLFGDAERRPEVIYARLADDGLWNSAIARTDWDELLKYRRRNFFDELGSLPTILKDRQRRARWDLARAVRARHSLFHRGQALEDQYLIAIFFSAFDSVMRLRMGAQRDGKPFETLVRGAVRQHHEILTGSVTPAAIRHVTLGWP